MASLSLYDTCVPGLIRSLKGLAGLIKKAQEHCDQNKIPYEDFTTARLAPDMAPLTFQIQTASNTAKFVLIRVAGIENEVWEDNETTFEQLEARITKTIEFMSKAKPEDFVGKHESEFEFHNRPFTGLTYVSWYAIPNFYFHYTTAYAILRMKGVQIGKLDYLSAN